MTPQAHCDALAHCHQQSLANAGLLEELPLSRTEAQDVRDASELGRQLLPVPLRRGDRLDHLATCGVEEVSDALGNESAAELKVSTAPYEVLKLVRRGLIPQQGDGFVDNE